MHPAKKFHRAKLLKKIASTLTVAAPLAFFGMAAIHWAHSQGFQFLGQLDYALPLVLSLHHVELKQLKRDFLLSL